MTGAPDADTDGDRTHADGPRKRATLRTRHADAATVAAAVAPDNTDRMHTRIEDEYVVTRIERGSTGGLRSTVDDYVVNLRVADAVGATARDAARNDEHSTTDSTGRSTDSDSTTHDRHDT
jgi:hypothetical protein